MTTFEPFDIVEVFFPFIDAPIRKVRPALVLSFPEFNRINGVMVLAMVTSAGRASWHHDVVLEAWQQAGLRKPSIVRWKVFTLESAMVLGRRGRLAEQDQKAVRNALTWISTDHYSPKQNRLSGFLFAEIYPTFGAFSQL